MANVKTSVSNSGITLHKGSKPYFSFDSNPGVALKAHRLPELVALKRKGNKERDNSALQVILSDALQAEITRHGMSNEQFVIQAYEIFRADRAATRKAELEAASKAKPTKKVKPVEGAAGLASLLSTIAPLAPEEGPEVLVEKLETLISDHKDGAIKILKSNTKGEALSRNEAGFILLRKKGVEKSDEMDEIEEELEAFLKEEAPEVLETKTNNIEEVA